MTNRSDLREELARLLLGEEPTLTGLEATDRGGLSVEQGERLWRALGFPNAGEAAAYGERDVEAIEVVVSMMRDDLVDEATVFRLTRALGQTMAKLADWQVATIVDQVEHDVAAGRAESRLVESVEIAQRIAPRFEALLLYAWRRHLAAAAARLEALGAVDAELLSTTMTVGFADLSRFTAMSNSLDQAALGALVEDFESRATDVIASHGGRVIKALGDAVLFVNTDPAAAVRTALEVVQHIGSRENLPDVRVALATGSVVSRLGDVFGPPVNLAARLSHVARSNRVLIDDATAAGLGDGEFEMRALPARPLRGFGNVSPITVSRRRGFRPRVGGRPSLSS